ncbi:multi-sensor hybrid histidine kinase [Actinoplanes sp. SE50]|uniref:PAS domain-containing sensor histidine kinase n=1 Tax=unclassified Actinoplanes TaxID=2626549 RepID=UPI00023ECC9B|nr:MULTISPECIES: PAS domain-containing sensor histidine kinase [unclassified Actinoplanes]AEV84290.1 multi-sensor hybrid histidine kinase [Actinoplanes sp. SE50/110]ATO82682.1 multi-sensor hybrid histidine kinase [Actinoplanes sp. SE50]SLM00089.1 multi-sensor hybrid histidine kinase [Actinoplanes sp. SE50/110]
MARRLAALRRGQRALPWIGVTAALALMAGAWLWSGAVARHDETIATAAALATDVRAVENELARYADVLAAADAALSTGKGDDSALAAVSGGFDLPHRYPGALAILAIDRDAGGAAVVRTAQPQPARGYPIGTDLSTVPQAAATFGIATQARRPALSAPIPASGAMAGTVLAIRAAGADRYVGLHLDVQRFLDGLYGRAEISGNVRITDVSHTPTLLAVSVDDGRPSARTDEVAAYGRRWQIGYTPTGTVTVAGERTYRLVLQSAAALLCLVLLATVLGQARSRRRAVNLAERLSESEERRNRLIDTSPIPILEVDPQGTVEYENGAAARLLGHRPGAVLGSPLHLTVHRADGEPESLSVTEDLDGEPMTIETGAGPRWVIAYCTDTFRGRGRLLLLSDETPRHELQEQLAQVHRMEALGRLAARIAHDFNNLLTPIGGYLDLVLTGGNDLAAEDRDALTECRKATGRAAALVDQILAISRQQHDGTSTVTDVAAGVASMTGLLRRIIGPDRHLEVGLPPDDAGRPFAAIEPTALEQILVNLVTNARDATPAGGRITVTVDAGDTVRISVADTGAGMDDETLARVFDPFFSTKRDHGGTGLGLATVHAIVDGAGGHLAVESRPGQGTTFTIALHRHDAPPSDPAAEPAAATAPPAAENQTVLLVEDDPQVRQLAQRILQRHGYRVLACGTAEEAEKRYTEQRATISILLTDVMLPGMSGPELARTIAKVDPDLPTVFMSGYSDGELTDQGQVPAHTTLLAKPFPAADLTRTVAEALADAP